MLLKIVAQGLSIDWFLAINRKNVNLIGSIGIKSL